VPLAEEDKHEDEGEHSLDEQDPALPGKEGPVSLNYLIQLDIQGTA
jgi:hypothetical protein